MTTNKVNKMKDALWSQMLEIIDRAGWAVQCILPDEHQPPYAYTVGLTAHGLPELLMIGLQHEDALPLLNGSAKAMVAGVLKPGHRQLVTSLTELPLALQADDEGKTMLTLMRSTRTWASENGLTPNAMQLVAPDRQGRFPWDAGCERRLVELQDPSTLLRIEVMREDEELSNVRYQSPRLQ